MDQVYRMGQISEKLVSKGKSLYVAHMDLEKVYDRTEREAMWPVFRMYVNNDLITGIKHFIMRAKHVHVYAVKRATGLVLKWVCVRVVLCHHCYLMFT